MVVVLQNGMEKLMISEHGQLLARQSTTGTYPTSSNKFRPGQGFADKAIEHLAETRAGASLQ